MIGLTAAAALQGQQMTRAPHDSLFYTLLVGDEVREGPLDPAAYAQEDSPGVGGARLAVAEAGLGVDIITFDSPEVNFVSQLGGNAVVAPLSPVIEEETEQKKAKPRTGESKIYTVQSGDTVASVAEKFNLETTTILWANGLSKNDPIKIGDHLTILPTDGILHTVRSGDTLLAIARNYQAEALKIKEFNGMEDSHKLSVGQKLIIPEGKVAPSIPTQPTRVLADNSGPAPASKTPSGSGFVWPTTTKHISQYFRWGHTGIDIDNRSMPAIYAADGGTVEFAGWLGAYGNLVIVNHGGGLQTYYAHNSKFYVSKGDKVAKGQAIAQMGSTGRSTGPHVHFEVRQNGRPINPLGMY